MSVIIDRITDGAPVGRCVRGGTYTGMTRKTPGEPCSPVIVSTSGGGASETVSDPTLSGSSTAATSTAESYTASGSSSSSGHSLEYFFDWGDGTDSGWTSATASYSWASAGSYNVRVKARCSADTSVVSGWSSVVPVTVSDPAEFAHSGSGIVTASSAYTAGSESVIIDGTDSYWVGTNNGVDWVQLDVGRSAYRLTSYAIKCTNATTRAPKNWTLEARNYTDVTWTTLDTRTNVTGWSSGETKTFSVTIGVTPYRYFRLNITANNGAATYIDIREMYLYGIPGTYLTLFSPQNMTANNSPSPFVVSASSQYASEAPWHAFDGSASTGWLGNNGPPNWIKIDLGAASSICVGYEIEAGAIELARAPKNWVIEGSADNSSWLTLDTVSNSTGWLAGERRAYACDTATTAYRYYRVTISANNQASQYTRIHGLRLFAGSIS